MEDKRELNAEDLENVTGGMDAYTGQLIEVAFDFAPRGFLKCDGATYQIREYPELFYLIGTKYGGDGVNTFAVPDRPGYCICANGEFPSQY